MLKGTGFVFDDLREKPHLIVWALVGGMLWAVANTLTIFAVRTVGLAIAFPLWNTNSLVGLFWGCLLFKELRGSRTKDWVKVIVGAGGNCVWRGSAGSGDGATKCRHAGKGGHRHYCRAGRWSSAGHDVHSLPQGLHQRHESAFVCDDFYIWRTGNGVFAGMDFFMAAPAAGWLNFIAHGPMLFWPFLGGFCWVIGRSVSKLCGEVPWGSGAGFRFPIRISFGAWRGARWYLANLLE